MVASHAPGRLFLDDRVEKLCAPRVAPYLSAWDRALLKPYEGMFKGAGEFFPSFPSLADEYQKGSAGTLALAWKYLPLVSYVRTILSPKETAYDFLPPYKKKELTASCNDFLSTTHGIELAVLDRYEHFLKHLPAVAAVKKMSQKKVVSDPGIALQMVASAYASTGKVQEFNAMYWDLFTQVQRLRAQQVHYNSNESANVLLRKLSERPKREEARLEALDVLQHYHGLIVEREMQAVREMAALHDQECPVPLVPAVPLLSAGGQGNS